MAEQPSRQRLAQALRNAHNAGDTEAATRLAAAIRRMDAEGGAQSAPSGLRGTQQPQQTGDPVELALANIPNAADRDRDLIERILEAREAGDARAERRHTSHLSGRVAARSDDSASFGVSGRAESAARGLGSAMFGAGDILSAGVSFARGKLTGEDSEFGFGDHLAFSRGRREASSDIAPVSNVAGMVPGVLTGVGAVRAGGQAAARVAPEATRRVGQIAGFQRGQTAANVGRSAVGGGAAAGVTAGIETGGDVEVTRDAALLGAAAGPVAERVLGAGMRGFQAIRRRMSPDAAATAELARRVDPSEVPAVRQRMDDFRGDTAQEPALVDVLDERVAADLAPAASTGTDGATELMVGLSARNLARPERMGGALRSGQPEMVSPTRATALRDKQANEAMGQIGEQRVDIPDAGELLDRPAVLAQLREVAGSLPRSERPALNEAIEAIQAVGEAAGSVQLTLRQVDSLRRALAQMGDTSAGTRHALGTLSDDIDKIARGQSLAYRRYMEEFAASSQYIDGLSEGARVLNRGGTAEFIERGAAQTPAGRRGFGVGAQHRAAEEAFESPENAARLARNLGANPGLRARLRNSAPEAEADRLMQVGATEARSANAVEAMARGSVNRNVRSEQQRNVQEMIGAGVLTTGRASASFIGNQVMAFVRFAGNDPQRAIRLARALTSGDPAISARAIQRLEALGATREQIMQFRQVFGTQAAASTARDRTQVQTETAFEEP